VPLRPGGTPALFSALPWIVSGRKVVKVILQFNIAFLFGAASAGCAFFFSKIA
jgi:hypothetical protein